MGTGLSGNGPKLEGTTVNCWTQAEDSIRDTHMQSMFLAFDLVGLEIFLAAAQCAASKSQAISIEARVSSAFLLKGMELAPQQVIRRFHGPSGNGPKWERAYAGMGLSGHGPTRERGSYLRRAGGS